MCISAPLSVFQTWIEQSWLPVSSHLPDGLIAMHRIGSRAASTRSSPPSGSRRWTALLSATAKRAPVQHPGQVDHRTGNFTASPSGAPASFQSETFDPALIASCAPPSPPGAGPLHAACSGHSAPASCSIVDVPDSASQSRHFPSRPAVAKARPSGRQASASQPSAWAGSRRCRARPVSGSKTKTCPETEAAASRWPSGDHATCVMKSSSRACQQNAMARRFVTPGTRQSLR